MNKFAKMITAASILLLGACAGGSGTPAEPSPELHTYNNISWDAGFDTIFTYQEATETKEVFDARFSEAVSLFTYYNNLFDIYNEYDGMNNLYTVNANAGKEAIKVDPDLIEMLEKARDFYSLSGGKFDITIGSLLSIWHEYRTEGIDLNTEGKPAPVPEYDALSAAMQHSGWDCVEINKEESTVFITDPEVSLDVGGIAKGFAVEKIARKLSEQGAVHGAVNAGGNTRTLGQKYNGQAWRIGIQNPEGDGSLLVVQQEGACSFVTSGDYERFYIGEDGKSYHHIIDSSTLYPADYFRSVSILTPDSADADALSTTLFTMSYEDGIKLIEAYKKQHPGTMLEVIWLLDPDREVNTELQRETHGLKAVWTQGLSDKIIWSD